MALVPDERLLHPAVSLHHIYQVVNDAVLQSHHHIQIPKAYIRINQTDLLAQFCQTRSHICGCGGLTHTAFT